VEKSREEGCGGCPFSGDILGSVLFFRVTKAPGPDRPLGWQVREKGEGPKEELGWGGIVSGEARLGDIGK